ncbi:MAG: translation initiation factor IF-3 [Candidatus Babeliales bacterium]
MEIKKDKGLPINEHIRVPKIQVITADGRNLGVISRDQALMHAREAGLDLVMLAEHGAEGVPVAKIVDYGKVLYEKKKKQAEAKKHQKVVQVKEIKIRPKIGEHDYLTKIKQGIQFLKDGKHLKITIMFRGREMVTSKERGQEMLDKIDKTLQECGVNTMIEKESRLGMNWFRIYILKTK